jgi:esterase/lipase superfamily enzyme
VPPPPAPVEIELNPAPVSKFTVTVFYGTDRVNAEGGYTDRYTPNLKLGVATVSIPPGHKPGVVETTPLIDIVLHRTAINTFILAPPRELNGAVFFRRLNSTIHRSTPKQLFVYIHGFGNSFEDSVFRAAQIAFDIKFEGAPVVFSWPSDDLTDYRRVRSTAKVAAHELRRFLDLLAERSDAEVIHIIVHSMGNYVLQQALSADNGGPLSWSDTKLHEVVLAAADLDAEGMLRLTRALRRRTPRDAVALSSPRTQAPHVTLYSSQRDRALWLSFFANLTAMAGRLPGNPVMYPSSDTVDLSAITDDFLGHSTFAENDRALKDLQMLIGDESPPIARGLLHVPPLWTIPR